MGIGNTKYTKQQLEENISRTDSTQERVDLTNSLAWKLRIRDPERARSFCEKALELSRSTDGSEQEYVHGIASSLVVLSFLDGEAGNLDTALSRSLEALSYITDQSKPEILIGAWYTLGWTYYYMGDYPASLEFGLKSLEVARKSGFAEWEVWCLDLVASTYKDPTQALQMYQDAYNIFVRMDNIEGQSRILNNWASTLFEVKEYVSALELAQKSLQMAKDCGLKGDEINVSATIAEILAAMGDYQQAQSKLHTAISLFDEYGRDISSVSILTDLGQVYLRQNKLDLAEQQLLSALEASLKIEMRNEQARCHQYLSEIYERRGSFDQALKHFKNYQKLKDDIAGEGAHKQLAALRVSHQIENAQRDAEIQRLQKEKLRIELDELKRLHAILEDLAIRDPLTNLFNRRHFLGLAEQEWKRSMRYGHPLCALMMDVDDFKKINDQHGHAAGDKALTSVANIIQSTLRSTEIAGRYGGDEFVILLPETRAENGMKVAQRISQAIKEYVPSSEVGIINLSTSIGIACASVEQHKTIKSLNQLLSHADEAMYTTKRNGRGQIHLYLE